MARANGTPDGSASPNPAEPERAKHRLASWIVIVVASFLAVLAIVTTWVHRQILDNHSWESASKQVVADPQVRSALATYMVNQLYANVDVQGELEQRLPKQTKALAAPIAAALRPAATQGAEQLLARPRVQQLWVQTSATAHQKLINVLENKTGYGISTGNGVVTLNLHDMVTQLGEDLGISSGTLAKLPNNGTELTLMKSNQLSLAQGAVNAIKVASAWLLVLVFGLYALAIYLARGARREALRGVGGALVVVGLITLVVRRLVGNYVVDTLSSPLYHGPVRAVWLIGTQILAQIGAAAILYGIFAILAAWIAGPSRLAVWSRRTSAPAFADHVGAVALVLGVLYLLVVLWGPTHALRAWWGILLFAILLAAGTEILRRQIAREAAAAPVTEGPADTDRPTWRERIAGGSASEPEPAKSRADELAQLTALHDSGALSDDEFERAKAHVLS
jgi:hypothetical protein